MKSLLSTLWFFFLLTGPLVSVAQQHAAIYANLKGDTIVLKEGDVAVVIGDMNCKGCFRLINELKKEIRGMKNLYCIIESQSIGRSELLHRIQANRNYLHLSDEHYIFRSGNSGSSLLEGNCEQSYTPFLVIRKQTDYSFFCYNELFSENADFETLCKKIRSAL